MRFNLLPVFIYIFFQLSLFISLSAFAVPNSMTFQTKIFKPDGLALESSAVNFRFTSVDPTGTCILYVEDFTNVNMANSAGLLVFSLGNGTKIFPAGAFIYSSIFDNLQPSFACQGGGTYLPGVARTDSRKIVLQFNDASGAGWQTLPAVDITSIPYANYAGDSQKFGGLIVTDFLRFSALPTCLGADVLTYNGTSVSCVTPSSGGGGTVTSVSSANTDIAVISAASTPVLTLNSGTGNNQIVKLNGTAQLPAVNGSLLTGFTSTQIPALDSAKITTGVFPILRGGTNNGTLPVTAGGVIYTDGTKLMNVGAGSSGQVLSSNAGGAPTWINASTGSVTSITAGTGLTGGAITTSGTIGLDTELTGLNSLATLGFVKRNGAGAYATSSVSLSADVSGTLPVANGGTGASTKAGAFDSLSPMSAVGDLIYGGVAGTGTRLPAATSGFVLTSTGSGSAPSWQATQASSLSSLTPATSTHTMDNLDFAQTWNWSSATSQSPLSISANALTTGSLLNLSSSSASLNSTNGLLNIANTSTSTSGILARLQSNSTAGSGLTVLADGKVGIGTSSPFYNLSLGGASAQTIGVESTGGSSLSILAGGANPAANDAVGGDLILSSGASRGSAASSMYFKTPQGVASGSSAVPTNRMSIDGAGKVHVGGAASPNGILQIEKTEDNFVDGTRSHLNFATAAGVVHQAMRVDTGHGLNFDTYNGTDWGTTMTLDKTRKVGIGNLAPSAILHLKAGTASINTAPLKFTSGVNLTTPEAGAVEYDGTNLYYTDSTNARRTLATSGSSYSNGSTIQAASGTAANPSLSFSGDTDTGLYSASANTIGVSAGGANIFNISTLGIVSPTTGGAAITSATGTAAAPTYSFAGDPSTGWYRPAASTMAASTGGAEAMRIDSSGNVGIGTTTPSSKLDVRGTNLTGSTGSVVNLTADTFDNLGSDPTLLNLNTPTGGTPRGNIFKAANTTTSFTISNNPSANGSSAFTTITNGGYNKFAPGWSSETAMLAIGMNSAIWFDGNTPIVGTGINLNITGWGGSSPTIRDVYGVPIKIRATNPSATSTAFYADVAGAQNNWAFYAASGKSYFGDNVGIGTTSPGYKLDVVSNAANGIVARFIDASTNGLVVGTTAGGLQYIGNNTGAKIIANDSNLTATVLYSNNAERMRIDSSGNVGIGTTTPAAKLDVYTSAGVGAIALGGVNGISFPASDTTAGGSIAIGALALASQTTSGAHRNTAVGYQALTSTTGNRNTGLGFQAMSANTSGNDNVAVGVTSLLINTTGTSNTAVGYSSMLQGSTGNYNSALGAGSLGSNPAGSYNVALGFNAVANGGPGNYNTGVGTKALFQQGNGSSNNVGIGANAILNSYSGSNNVALGTNVGPTLFSGSNNILIGTDATTDTAAAGSSNSLNIASAIYANNLRNSINAGGIPVVGIGVASPTARLHLPAGTTAANMAPLKFESTAATLMTAPEAGAVEYDGTNLYFTDSTNARRTLGTVSGADASYVAKTGSIMSGSLGITSTNQVTLHMLNSTTGVRGGLSTDFNGGFYAGSINSNPFILGTDYVERMRIDPSGNVAIGTTSNSNGLTPLNAKTVIHNTTGSNVLSLESGVAGGSVNLDFDGLAGNGLQSGSRVRLSQLQGAGGWDTIFTISSGGGGTLNERMRIDATGNVGIGTISPSKKLDVNGSLAATDLLIEKTIPGNGWANKAGIAFSQSGPDDSTASARNAGIIFGGSASQNNKKGGIFFAEDGTGNERGTLILANNGGADANSATINDSVLAIKSNGNVGIGTTSPDYKLSILTPNVAGASNGLKVLAGTNSSDYSMMVTDATFSKYYMTVRGDGKLGIGTAAPADLVTVSSGTAGGSALGIFDNSGSAAGLALPTLRFGINSSSGFNSYDAARIWAQSTSANTADLHFSTYNSAAPATPKMTLQASGNVGIGTTTPLASALLDITSTSMGFLLPRMTAVQRNAIVSPATGLQVYNTDANTLDYYNGTAWTTSSGLSGGGGIAGSNGAVNITAGGTNQSITLTSSGTGVVTTPSATTITNNSASLSSTSGALVVTGGVGIGGAVNATGNINSGANISAATSITAPLIYGGVAASNSLTLDSTSNVTKGNIVLAPSGGNVGIGVANPNTALQVWGQASVGGNHIWLGGNLGGTTIPGDGTTLGTTTIGWNASNGLGESNFINSKGPGSAGGFTFDAWDGTTRSTRLKIDSLGRVGIGTTTPQYPFDVVGFSAGNVGVGIRNSDYSNGNSVTLNFNHDVQGGRPVASSISSTLPGGNVSNLIFSTSSSLVAPTERMRIDGSGNVGIGTTTPANRLTVADGGGATPIGMFTTSASHSLVAIDAPNSAQAGLRLLDSGSWKWLISRAPGNDNFSIDSNSGNRMTIDYTSGNVGIGTSAPSSKLQVAGSVIANLQPGGSFGGFFAGSNNLAMGQSNMAQGNIAGSNMVMIGSLNGGYLTDSTDSVFIGNNQMGGGQFSGTTPTIYNSALRSILIGDNISGGDGNGWYKTIDTVAIGYKAGSIYPGPNSTYIGSLSGGTNIPHDSNGFNIAIGDSAGVARSNEHNTVLGAGANAYNTVGDLPTNGSSNSYLTVIGAEAIGNASNAVVLGRATDDTLIGAASKISGLTAKLQVTGNGYFSGNVGIGTITPTQTLHVAGSQYTSGVVGFGVAPQAYGNSSILTLNGTGYTNSIHSNINGTGEAVHIALRNGNGPVGDIRTNGTSLTFGTNNAEKMRIDSSGNVGISQPTPLAKLDVQQTAAGSAAILAESGGTNFLKVLNPAGGITNSFNAANSVLYVGSDTVTGRSINASGTVSTGGADFAEWVDWASENKPEMGSIVLYKGGYVVVSSPFTAAFVGNDTKDPKHSILVAFAGQLPVLVRGVVHEGDLIVANGDGTGFAVSRDLVSLAQAKNAVGTAWASSNDASLKRVNVAVGIGLGGNGARDIASIKAENAELKAKVLKAEQQDLAKTKELEAVKTRLDKIEKALNSKK